MEPGAMGGTLGGSFAWASTDGPIEVLLGEHRTILQVLDEVERESRRVEAEQALREAFWADLLRFLDEFDAGLHHAKEERLLFPALEAHGLAADHGPTASLRDEHLRSRFWQQRIDAALRERDRNRLAAAAGNLVDLTRAHVLKENQILFPLVKRLLDPDELDRLHREFRLLAADQRLRTWIRFPYPGTAGAEAGAAGA
ncbi:MAG: hemerythrin domain-containing protein [Planctomycetes bacterium]|nr:hemerythrin domain-containing protein [Planctomycetota bacterium]